MFFLHENFVLLYCYQQACLLIHLLIYTVIHSVCLAVFLCQITQRYSTVTTKAHL